MSTTSEGSHSSSRYFLAAAGLGLHAKMIYQAHSGLKGRSGMMAYYRSGFRLAFLEPRIPFEVALTHADGSTRSMPAYELLAVKVALFSGIVKRWRPGSSLADPVLRFLLVKSPSRVLTLAGTLRCMIGGSPTIRGVDIVAATRAVCRPHPATDPKLIFSEADGETLGTLPAEITSIPEAFALLMPPS
jgi:diacylglycerol kinase family enzyme